MVVCTKKSIAQLSSKLCSCVHYILNFVQEHVKLHTNANLTFRFRGCFILLRPRPMVRSSFRKFLIYHLWTPSIVNSVRLCHGSVSNVWFRPWFRPGLYWGANSAPPKPIAGFSGAYFWLNTSLSLTKTNAILSPGQTDGHRHCYHDSLKYT